MDAAVDRQGMATVTLTVQGMSCAACVARVERTLKQLDGVAGVHVNLLTGKAAVEYHPGGAGIAEMVKAVRDLGYEVPEEELLLTVRGMSCAACVARVERAVRALPGVTEAVVNLPAESAKIRYYAGAIDKTRIKSEIDAIGYEASERLTGSEALDREERPAGKNCVTSSATCGSPGRWPPW